jgi:hypothetical protein
MTVPGEGTFVVRAEPAAPTETTAATEPITDGSRWLLPAGVLLLTCDADYHQVGCDAVRRLLAADHQ